MRERRGGLFELFGRLEWDLGWRRAATHFLLFLELFAASFDGYCYADLGLLLLGDLLDCDPRSIRIDATNLEVVHISGKSQLHWWCNSLLQQAAQFPCRVDLCSES